MTEQNVDIFEQLYHARPALGGAIPVAYVSNGLDKSFDKRKSPLGMYFSDGDFVVYNPLN